MSPLPERLPVPLPLAGRLGRDVVAIATRVREAGGRAWLAGGGVRDLLLGREVADADLEIHGLEPGAIEALLRPGFAFDAVGRAFGVWRLRGRPIDVALPRRESRTGPRHTDFAVEGDPFLAPAEACRRRDFTVNAMLADPLTGEILDPWGGRADLAAGVLRATSPAFDEDPLRVLRGMQFAARFGLRATEDTLARCRTLSPDDLPAERLFEEWSKLVRLGGRPSLGLSFLRDAGWLRFFPELAALDGCPQDPEWHPEGDAWTHTLHVMDAFAAARTGDAREDLVVGLACLCHDLGKPATTVRDPDGRIRSPGHEGFGEGPTRAFLARLTRETALVEDVVVLVVSHLRPHDLFRGGATDAAVRRLARRVGRIDRLLRVCAADMAGRPPRSAEFPAGDWLRETAARLAVLDAAPRPLLQGRDLVARGLRPGPDFGPILAAAYEAQLEGAFQEPEGARRWLDSRLAQRGYPVP